MLVSEPMTQPPHDAMSRHAPRRTELRGAHQPRWSCAPELFPWDYGLMPLDPARPDDLAALVEELVVTTYFTLERRYVISPTRPEAYALMDRAGIPTAGHGRVRDVPDGWDRVVVYTSEYGGHVGMDKELLPLHEARRAYPDAFCSQFLTPELPPQPLHSALPPEVRGVSQRDFVAGDYLMQAWMASPDWRSNAGGGTQVAWVGGVQPRRAVFREDTDLLLGPLFAIDYVWHGGQRYAIDFNACPGMTGAPHEGLPGASVAGAVQAWSAWQRLL